MLSQPERRRTVFDFGMHRGEDTAFYLAAGAEVVAFEANAALVALNRARFAEAIEQGRLTIIEGAIVPPGHQGETVTFYIDSRKSVWGTTSTDWAARNVGLGSSVAEVTVPAIDLPAILREHPDLLYAKIDIEGADQFVLASLKASSVTPDYVSIESDKIELGNVIAEIRLLGELGYTKFAAVQQATVPHRRFSGQGLDGTPFAYRFETHASGPFGPYLSQPFVSADDVIADYRRIFSRYRRFGDRSSLMRNAATRVATKVVNRVGIAVAGAPLCGWYDTHASK